MNGLEWITYIVIPIKWQDFPINMLHLSLIIR
jgi:hypothetical protein